MEAATFYFPAPAAAGQLYDRYMTPALLVAALG